MTRVELAPRLDLQEIRLMRSLALWNPEESVVGMLLLA